MLRYLFAVVGIAAFGLASPSAAQNSPCAALPQTGLVPSRTGNGEERTPPRVAWNGSMSCPAKTQLVTNNGPPYCRGTLPQMVQGNPRAECYAQLPFGPVSVIDQHARPIPGQCASRVNSFPIRGRGVGFNDVVVTLAPMTGTTFERLTDPIPATGNRLDSPAEQSCLGPDCRLVRLTTTATTPASAVFSIRLPGRPAVTRTWTFAQSCPKPPDLPKCPPLGGTSTGGTPPRNCR